MKRVFFKVALMSSTLLYTISATANCHNPYELYGTWQEGVGGLTVTFDSKDQDPLIGRMANIQEQKLFDVGYYNGYPIILMWLDPQQPRYGRNYSGNFSKRNSKGALPPSDLRVRLVKDSQSSPNVILLDMVVNKTWKTMYTLYCIDEN